MITCGQFLGADNLIPMELAQKIASKIRSKERFAVYVVIPMRPEGDPTSLKSKLIMQDILLWQVFFDMKGFLLLAMVVIKYYFPRIDKKKKKI